MAGKSKLKYEVSGFCGSWSKLGTTYAATEKKAVSNLVYRLNLKPDGKGGYFGNGLRYLGFKGKVI